MTTPIDVFAAEVAEITSPTPHTRRLTLRGPELADFGVPARPWRDLRIELVLPPRADDGSFLAGVVDITALIRTPGEVQPDGHTLGWYQRWLREDLAKRGWLRTYTVRAFREFDRHGAAELDIDIVLHGDGYQGPGSAWAEQAAVGHPVQVIGPRRSECGQVPDRLLGIDFVGDCVDDLLLVADDAAVPAAAAILAGLPPWSRGALVVETAGGVLQSFAHPVGFEVHHVTRCGKAGDAALARLQVLLGADGRGWRPRYSWLGGSRRSCARCAADWWTTWDCPAARSLSVPTGRSVSPRGPNEHQNRWWWRRWQPTIMCCPGFVWKSRVR